MRRVGILVLTLFLIFAGTLTAIRLIGQTLPSPDAVLFTNPDGSPCSRPCLLGIHPGVTKAVDAVALLHSHPLTRTAKAVNPEIFYKQAHLAYAPVLTFDVTGPGGDTLITLVETPDKLVDTITLNTGAMPGFPIPLLPGMPPASAALGTIILDSGVPDLVYNESGHEVYNFLKVGLNVPAPQQGSSTVDLAVNDPVDGLTLFRLINCPPDDSKGFAIAESWRGLSTFVHYSQSATNTQIPLRFTAGGLLPCLSSGGSSAQGGGAN